MLFSYRSHQLEHLLAQLARLLQTELLASPLRQELVLVGHLGMGQWLSQQLAKHLKVWGNFQYVQVGSFLNKTAGRLLGNPKAQDAEQVLWRLENSLRRLSHSEFEPLQIYLSGSQTELKRYQLAAQLARLFSRYQLLRPEMLAAWQQDQGYCGSNHETEERWQQLLWQQISRSNETDLWQQAIEKLSKTQGQHFGKLPERLIVFGVDQLSPIMLQFLQTIAQHISVHFFYCDFFLYQDPKPKAHTSLLSSLGQQGLEFRQRLLNAVNADNVLNPYLPKPTFSVLGCLQQVLLYPSHVADKLTHDRTVTIHACHSRMREVEVLKDQLLNSLETDPSLSLRDIIVMAPDISAYAPFISAVFQDVQHTIADIPYSDQQQAVQVFINFLHLSQSRLGWKSVLDVLESPLVYPAFDLTEEGLESVKHWLKDTGVRWGKSAGHRQELGLFASTDNTWQAMLERLLMGYALADDSGFTVGILPYKAIEGSSAQALGGLHDFLQLLFTAQSEFKQQFTLADWGRTLLGYASQLFAATEQLTTRFLNDLLLELSTLANVHQEPVSLLVMIAWLQDKLANDQNTPNRFLRAPLTFCSLQAMRILPFKVIALLGMNEGEFPPMQQAANFDLVALTPKEGDPCLRQSARYQFLQVLLSVRQQLVITYIGQSIKHNSKIPPSIVVTELLDSLAEMQQGVAVIYHPLHAFSARYFNGAGQWFSYSPSYFETAKAMQEAKTEPVQWWQGQLPVEATTVIELTELFAFFKHPQRYFLRQQLGVRFSGLEDEPQERENFALEGLLAYQVQQDFVADCINGIERPVAYLQAQGQWLQGVLGDLAAQEQQSLAADFVTRINAYQLGNKLDNLLVDLQIGHYRLVGLLENRYANGSLFYRYADLKGKDVLAVFLHHFIINQIQPQTTYLLGCSEELVFPAQCADDACLLASIELYLQGKTRPDVFFTEAALAYVQQAAKSNDDGAALKKANQALKTAMEKAHEPELQRLFSGATDFTPLLQNGFEQYCQTVLLPVWRHLHYFDGEKPGL